jgi:hypothetical protein
MASIPLRVMLTDVWDEFHLDVSSDTPLSQVKQRVLDLGRVTG